MITLLHQPFGQEHPYEQLPEERFPRQPLAQEPFRVGIVSRPVGAVQRVIVHSTLDGHAQAPFDANLVPNWRPELEDGVGAEFLERMIKIDQDVWHAPLTAPLFGQTLEYWFESEGVVTPKFTLVGEAWQTGGGITAHEHVLTLQKNATTSHTNPNIVSLEWLSNGSVARRVRLTVACTPDEAFFGLGERFNALNQRGNVMDIRCYEQYKNQGKRTYMPIPFLLSSNGYGVFVKSYRWMQFDLAATASDCWSLEADLGADESLDVVWFENTNILDSIRQFTRLTGPAVLPPLWAFGLWMSGNEWNSQKRVMHEVEQSLAYAIQPSVIVIEAWSDETTFYIWNDAQYTPKAGDAYFEHQDFTFPPEGKWHNPQGMIDQLHEHDIKILLWQIPVVKVLEQAHPQHEADRAHFEREKFGVKNADGTLHTVRPFWFRGGYIWDVTDTDAKAWWLNKRKYLLDMGIDGFKTDGGEHLWGTDTHFDDGRTGVELWNQYPQLYSQAYYDFANQHREAITFSRAGSIGSQKSPLHWAGDENSTWEAFQHSILAGLSAGISGISFWGWDLGGFSGTLPDAELYLRSTAMAVFCPVMQYHSEYNQHREPRDRTPWNIQQHTGDERVVPLFRHFVNIRHNLMPYIWREAQYSAESGTPMMQALRLFDAHAHDYAYFFGRDLLVYPITQPNVDSMACYLPAGEWCDLWTKTRYQGGQVVTVQTPLNTLPVFVRQGTQLPMRLAESGKWGDFVALSADANHIEVY